MANEKKAGGIKPGIGCGVLIIAIGIIPIAAYVGGFSIGWLIACLIAGLIFIKNGTEKKKLSKKLAEGSKIAIGVEKNYLEQFGPSTVAVSAGRYVTGHPKIEAPMSNVKAIVAGKDAILYCIMNPITPVVQELGRIPLPDVSDVRAEDRSSFESSVSAARVLALGVLALAAQKKEKHESYYVTVSWRDGNFTHETVFEFEGPQSPQNSNALRNLFIQGANAVQQGH